MHGFKWKMCIFIIFSLYLSGYLCDAGTKKLCLLRFEIVHVCEKCRKKIENSIIRVNQVARDKVTWISQGPWFWIENVYFHCIIIVSFWMFVRCRKKNVLICYHTFFYFYCLFSSHPNFVELKILSKFRKKILKKSDLLKN